MVKPGMMERFQKALPVLRELMKDLEGIEEGFDLDAMTDEERGHIKHLRALGHNPFNEAVWRIESMLQPDVLAQGRLVKNRAGRYEIEGTDYYFTSGSSCEIYVPFYDDEPGEHMTWLPTSIEHNKDYYFVSRPDVCPAGVLARVRGRR